MLKKNTHQSLVSFNTEQASIALATVIFTLFLTFMVGYFLGQKKAAQEFAYRLEQDSLADHIYSSLCSLYDPKGESDESNTLSDEAEPSEENNNEQLSPEISESVAPDQGTAADQTSVESTGHEKGAKQYHAIIAGYPHSLIENAHAARKTLARKGFKTELVDRKSKTAKGKTIVWHQLVTKAYDSYQSLLSDRTMIAKIAHVKENDILIEEVE